MPVCSCPHCGRKNIPFEMHEAESPVQCAKCDGLFTPLGGKLESPDFPEPPPIRRLPASADPEYPAGEPSPRDSFESRYSPSEPAARRLAAVPFITIWIAL